ncbi:PREDICTED: uncharacterized protein LOC105977607 [Erythranthe guttata]|nr:PREDICTED: uncharacterized protein LOC105977607 [Erythranthe guttata]|eukprot:XP_012858383.1 PREDICTED: uncharacterized protein LOC105977607 [Erythranthe guttata]
MSTLHNPSDIDLESGSCNNGGGGRRLSESKEIVGVAENDGNNNREEKHERRGSSSGTVSSECSVEVVDLESGSGCGVELTKQNSGKRERDCRICHLSMDASANQDSGIPIELGCSCKDDLAAAHQHCAEAWFNIKGNKTCEICGSIAQNVPGANEAESPEQRNEAATAAAESRNFWQGHRFLNFLLGCMVFAFVISWLFHFKVPP